MSKPEASRQPPMCPPAPGQPLLSAMSPSEHWDRPSDHVSLLLKDLPWFPVASRRRLASQRTSEALTVAGSGPVSFCTLTSPHLLQPTATPAPGHTQSARSRHGRRTAGLLGLSASPQPLRPKSDVPSSGKDFGPSSPLGGQVPPCCS